MTTDIRNSRPWRGATGGVRQPQAISLEEAARIAGQVQELIKEGKEHSALELIRSLHPADMGSILVGLPRTSREAMIRVMTPDTVAWMLRQLNPLEARRVGTRLGSQMLAFMLRQLHPSQALATLRLLHPSQALATLLLLHPSQALAALRLLHPRQVLAALRLLRPRQALAMLRRILFLRPREAAAAVEEPLEASEILAHPEDTAGSLMVEQLPTVNIGGTAGDARDSLRALADLRHRITHVYVVEGGDGLRGQISMVDLALAENAEPVRALAASTVATVTVETPVEECARLRRHYDLTQLPVVDGDRLIGLVPAAALLSATVEQDTLQIAAGGERGRRDRGRPAVRLHTDAAALADGQPGHDVPGRGDHHAVRVDAGPGGRARGVPARGRRAGRDRRHPDPDPDSAGDSARRARGPLAPGGCWCARRPSA